jgi:hypothetical protein
MYRHSSSPPRLLTSMGILLYLIEHWQNGLPEKYALKE